jgi:hypothetical protein
MSNWRFDDNDPGEIVFAEDVKKFAPFVRAAVERALIDILEDPLAKQYLEMVNGEVFYVSVMQPSLDGGEVIPTLLIIYTASRKEKRVRKVGLHRAKAVAPNWGSLNEEEMLAALRRAIQIARRRAKGRSH